MSWSLVNKALDLYNEQHTGGGDKKKGSSNKKPSKGGVDDTIGTKRQGVRKSANKNLRKQQKRSLAKQQLIEKEVNYAVGEYKKHIQINNTSDNIKLLRKIDRRKAPQQFAEQIAAHHSKELERKNKRTTPQNKTQKPDKIHQSVFSDEDFEKMNKDWLKLY